MPNFEVTSSPRDEYQNTVLAFNRLRNIVGNFCYYGGGKTFMSFKWLEDRAVLGEVMFPCVVVCPVNLIHQWIAEAVKHTRGLRMCPVITPGVKQRIERLRIPADIYLMNCDSITERTDKDSGIKKANPVLDYFLTRNFGSFIVDESLAFKDSEAKRFKYWRMALQNVKHRMLLSGEPLTERIEDLWAQFLLLDGGETLGSSFTEFRMTYFVPSVVKMGKWTLKEGAMQAVAERVKNRAIYIPQDVVEKNLPPKNNHKIEFELTPPIRKLYDDLRTLFAIELPSGANWETVWAMAKGIKLHQISSGLFYKEPEIESPMNIEILDTQKIQWLRHSVPVLLKQRGPVIIWCMYPRLLYLIQLVLNDQDIKADVFHGGLKDDERSAAIGRFQKGERDVLLLSTPSAFQGHNLQRARVAIWVNNSYVRAQRANSIKRNFRMGSECWESIEHFDLVMKNTTDEVVLQALEAKQDLVELFIKHVRAVLPKEKQ